MKKIVNKINNYRYKDALLLITYIIIIICLLYYITLNFNELFDGLYKVIKTVLNSIKPLLIGVILAYLIDPFVNAINTKLFKRDESDVSIMSILIVYSIIGAILVAVLLCSIYMLMGELPIVGLVDVTKAAIEYVSGYRQEIEGLLNSFPRIFSGSMANYISEKLNKTINEIISTADPVLTMKHITNIIINAGVAIVASVYIEKDKALFKKMIRKGCHLTLAHSKHMFLSEAWNAVNLIFTKYIRGTLLDSIIITAASSIFLYIIGMKFAIFWGIIIGLLNIIPYFGPIIAAVPIVTVGVISNGIISGMIIILGLILIQLIDSNYLYPKIVGESTGLHPLVILISVSAFGYLGGIIGMILAVPVAAILQNVIIAWAKKQ